MTTKAHYIGLAAKGKSKSFPRIHEEVKELFKGDKPKRSAQWILGVALQIYVQQRFKGSWEYANWEFNIWKDGAYHDNYLGLDRKEILTIRLGTILDNVVAFKAAKRTKNK